MRLLRAVLEALESMHVRSALIGAGAMATYGVSRATRDIDLLAVDTAVFKEDNWGRLRTSKASIEVRRGEHDDPLAGVVRITADDDLPVDLVVGKFQWQQAIVDRARLLAVGPAHDAVELPVARAADLILLKLYAGGQQDLWDIRQLLDNDRSIEKEAEALVSQLPEECRRVWRKLLAEPSRRG